MQQLILDIDESRYLVLLKFLKTLEYVRIVKPEQPKQTEPANGGNVANQLALLNQMLQQQSKPLFQHISDPADWQKLQRDEWS